MGGYSPEFAADVLRPILDSHPQAKAHARPRQGRDQDWLCVCADCDFATARKANYAHRESCYGCCRPKAQALSPPAAVRLSEPDKTTVGASQRNGRIPGMPPRNRPQQPTAAGGKKDMAAAAATSAQQQVAVEARLASHGPLAAAARAAEDGTRDPLSVPIVCDISDLVVLGVSPPEPPAQIKTAADYLESFLPKSAGDTAAVAAAVKEKGLYVTASEGMPEDSPARASLASLIAATDMKIAKLQKAGKGPACERAALDHVRTSMVKAASEHENIVAQAASREESRTAAVMKRIEAARAELDAFETVYAEKRGERTAAWRAVNERRAERDAAALALLSERFGALPPPADGVAVSAPMDEDGAPPAALADLQAQLAAVTADRDRLQQLGAQLSGPEHVSNLPADVPSLERELTRLQAAIGSAQASADVDAYDRAATEHAAIASALVRAVRLRCRG